MGKFKISRTKLIYSFNLLSEHMADNEVPNKDGDEEPYASREHSRASHGEDSIADAGEIQADFHDVPLSDNDPTSPQGIGKYPTLKEKGF